MSSSLLVLAQEGTQQASSGMPSVGYGIVALAVLAFGLLVTLAFRSVGTRHR